MKVWHKASTKELEEHFKTWSCHCGADGFKNCICFDTKQLGYKD